MKKVQDKQIQDELALRSKQDKESQQQADADDAAKQAADDAKDAADAAYKKKNAGKLDGELWTANMPDKHLKKTSGALDWANFN